MKDKRNSKGKQEADRIRVFVRVRPLSTDEQKKGEKPGVEIAPDRAEIKLNDTRERRYKFDKVFHLSATNKEVFNWIGRPLVDTAFHGFNGTLMAYGQTGSGKTYTLMSSDGIAVQCVDKLFRRIYQDCYHQYKVYMSYLQIYQEKIYDLLNQNGKMELYLREDPKRGVFVENLTEYVVRSTNEVFNLLRAGKKRLVFAETRMNRVSSRSHAVCQITVERSRKKDAVKTARASSVGESTSDSKTLQSSRSLSSLDRCSGISRIPTPKKPSSPSTLPSKIPTFSPHITSTPNLAIASSKPNPIVRHSLATSIPSPDFLLPDRCNRWSSTEMLRSQSGASLVSGVSESDFSDLFVDLDESDSERNLRASSSSTDVVEDDEDDDAFLESIRLQDDVVVKGHINICDLAGSERIKRSLVEGERLSELQHINLSLLELGNTIHALSEGNRTHIPFRNSSLTRLLQDSLGGNCKTSFVMCVSPRVIDLNETRCTLDFGQRAKQITTNAYMNIEVDFAKLAEDLRKRLEVQELEMKMQRENFERQALAIHDESEVKISELQAQLEMEREAQIERETQLEAEKEKLKNLLEEEKRNSGTVKEHQKVLIEKTLQEEICKIARREQLEREKLSKQLEEEKRHSLLLVQREKEKMDKQLEEERRRFNSRMQVERSKFEKELVEKSNRYEILTEEQLRKLPVERRRQGFTLEQFELPSINIGSERSVDEGSFETLFNVLLAEMMSLQLLYQIQDLSSACNSEAVRSRDSGWVDYDDDIIEAVGTNLLEKGGLLLTNLRAAKQGDAISVQSTDSLRDFLNLQLPHGIARTESKEKTDELPQFKAETYSKPVDEAPLKDDSRSDMSSEATRSGSPFSSEGSTCVRLSSSSSSTFGSYLEDEPLSPKRRMRPADSGCSSIYTDSDTDHSPIHKTYHDIPVIAEEPHTMNKLDSVPLALEEEDEFELDEEMEQIERPLDEKLSQLENHLMQLKSELDIETFSFFSQVFGMDISNQREKEASSLTMRHLLEGLTQTLLENHGLPCKKELNLSPAVMEESVNLLLVNKTVMSCILVLKNRQQEAKKPDLTYNKTVIQVTPKVEQETQTDVEQPRTLRRRVRRDTGTVTDPVVAKPETKEEGVQTNLAALLRPFEVLDSCSSSMSSLGPDDPWSKTLDEEMERSAVPDGASDVNSHVENEPSLTNGASGHDLSSEQEQSKDKLIKRRRRHSRVSSLLSCFGPAFQRKASGSKQHDSSRSETSKLVKE